MIHLFIADDQTNDLNIKTFSYAQDPCANQKTGLGYSVSSKNKNGGSISFIKGETINLQSNQNSTDKNKAVAKQQNDSAKNCDIINGNVKFKQLSVLLKHF